MCSEYGVTFNPASEAILTSYERTLMYVSPPDLSMKKVTTLAANNNTGWSWGDVNIGHGFRPS
jgi:hypothetical protein